MVCGITAFDDLVVIINTSGSQANTIVTGYTTLKYAAEKEHNSRPSTNVQKYFNYTVQMQVFRFSVLVLHVLNVFSKILSIKTPNWCLLHIISYLC